tara:strand:- start:6283 stop:7164 length:882 start_codon:yes stop_codon:yes gene_type:complete
MLYKEAYELIDIILQGQDTTIPLSGKLKQRFFHDGLKMMGRRYVRNIQEETFTGNSSTTKYIFSNENATDKIYQIQFKSSDGASSTYTDIPFLPQSLITNPDEVNTSSYVVRQETSKNGIWTDFNQVTKVVTTSENHGLSIGDYVKIYDTGLSGLEYDNGIVKRVKITAVTENTFTISASLPSGSQTGKKSPYRQEQVELILTKATGAGTITVRYYADPKEGHNYQDVIDLDETLCKASIYCAIKELMALDGQLEVSKAMNDVSGMYEEQYVLESNTRQPQIDKLPMPLQDFT